MPELQSPLLPPAHLHSQLYGIDSGTQGLNGLDATMLGLHTLHEHLSIKEHLRLIDLRNRILSHQGAFNKAVVIACDKLLIILLGSCQGTLLLTNL